MGTAYPPIMYIFACQEVQLARNILLGIVTSLSVLSFGASMHPLFESARYRPIRAIMYICSGFSIGLPFYFSLAQI